MDFVKVPLDKLSECIRSKLDDALDKLLNDWHKANEKD